MSRPGRRPASLSCCRICGCQNTERERAAAKSSETASGVSPISPPGSDSVSDTHSVPGGGRALTIWAAKGDCKMKAKACWNKDDHRKKKMTHLGSWKPQIAGTDAVAAACTPKPGKRFDKLAMRPRESARVRARRRINAQWVARRTGLQSGLGRGYLWLPSGLCVCASARRCCCSLFNTHP